MNWTNSDSIVLPKLKLHSTYFTLWSSRRHDEHARPRRRRLSLTRKHSAVHYFCSLSTQLNTCPSSVFTRAERKFQVRQCLGFSTVDFWSSSPYESAKQIPKHCLTWDFSLPLLFTSKRLLSVCTPLLDWGERERRDRLVGLLAGRTRTDRWTAASSPVGAVLLSLPSDGRTDGCGRSTPFAFKSSAPLPLLPRWPLGRVFSEFGRIFHIERGFCCELASFVVGVYLSNWLKTYAKKCYSVFGRLGNRLDPCSLSLVQPQI